MFWQILSIVLAFIIYFNVAVMLNYGKVDNKSEKAFALISILLAPISLFVVTLLVITDNIKKRI